MRNVFVVLAFVTPLAGVAFADPPAVIKQDFKKDAALEITGETSGITEIVQTGKVKRYTNAMLEDGVHIRTGKETVLSAVIKPGNYHSGGLIGVHGEGTHVRFRGTWKGDQGGAYPSLVLTKRGKMTWEAAAEVDFVMHPNFFTRQLWVWGDGTGILEIEEGFISDRTKGATVANAMGTIRLAGATLVTHHSHSLPYNNRPDGRGGIYHNGHVVFEHRPDSKWVVKSNPHIYAAQIDFDAGGTIDCQAPLTHNGQRRDCLPVGNGGKFVSTGAFRTTKPDVTITKTGPAMLSLEGQQGYRPGAGLVVKEGLLRIYTDPGDGKRIHPDNGPYLSIEVEKGGSLLLAAPRVQLEALHLHAGSRAWQMYDCRLEAKKLEIDKEADFQQNHTVK